MSSVTVDRSYKRDNAGISELCARSVRGMSEIKAKNLLNAAFQRREMPLEARLARTVLGNRERYDLEIMDGDRSMSRPLLKVEVEQHSNPTEWDDMVPWIDRGGRWSHFSVVARKDPGEWDVFLKMSATLRGAFMVEADLISLGVDCGRITTEVKRTNMQVDTCNLFHIIPQSLVHEVRRQGVWVSEGDGWDEVAEGVGTIVDARKSA